MKTLLRHDSLNVVILPVLQDNYIYLLHDEKSGHTAAVDPALADPVLAALEVRGWKLTHLFITHHHHDHVGGNLALKAATNCEILGFALDAARIPGIDRQLRDGEKFRFAGHPVEVLFLPGHTSGHIAYYFSQDGLLFSGDVLFSLGCGRLFEGTAEQMFHSLARIASLPGETQLCCTHEYTEANGRFALTLEPGNTALQNRMQEVRALRAGGQPTVPTRLDSELAANPFLRWHSPEIRRHISMEQASDLEVFTEIRRRKDIF